MNLHGTGTRECLCTDDTLLCAICVLVENTMAYVAIEFVLSCGSCELQNIILCNDQLFNP